MAKRIEAVRLSCYFGSTAVVRDVSMAVEAKSITALIGPSGCGKSTLLRSLNRMHELAPGARVTGRVLLDEADIYAPGVDPVAVRRTVGMIFERPSPFPAMSIYENVVAGLRLTGRRRHGELDDVAERSLREAQLWDEVTGLLRRSADALTPGQQQRLCIARALAVGPEVLLMDEPCGSLDALATLAVEDVITELKRRYTIVLVTHDMQQAARVSDVTAFLARPTPEQPGRLIEVDATARIFANPADRRTEDYITGRLG